MTASAAEVASRAAEIADAARAGGVWLEANQARLRLDAAGVSHAFRRFARRAQRLRVAADRQTCVAVFGASQAGKSYLVSSLATSRNRPLTAVYGDRRVNFLRELNPQGDKEATGLVTRFTVRPVPAPPDAPVALRLMSQTDLVKILANAFLEDFKVDDLKPPEAAAIAALFDRLAAAAGPAPQGDMSVDDIEEMREYFEQYFRAHPLIVALGPGYWLRAIDVIPRLPATLRAEAFEPLWNGLKPFTEIAGKLIAALESIGSPATAFCGLDALMPRESGVLNADTVFGLGVATRGQVRVVSSSGRAAMLDRALLAALIAEMTVPLAEQPWDFLGHTDLLDFPGARSRELIRSPEDFLDAPGRLGRVFLRGKVAYLFQRYNAEQEISAMLLCVGPSNQDVQTLPEMVAAWIDQTIGATREARAAQRNSLFLVLTKFDSEFIDKAGEVIGTGQRWTTRLEASLLDYFGKAYEWPHRWTPTSAFNNTFWLRSTGVAFPSVYDYERSSEPDGGPTEVLAERADAAIAPRYEAYINNESVQKHFADPFRAWSEVLKPNDGGISYLAERLRPVCDPSLKAEQIDGRLQELARDVVKQLAAHYHTGDLAAELERARDAARQVARALRDCAQAQMFGSLLRALQVTADEILSVYWRLQSEGDAPVPIGAASGQSDYDELDDLLGDPTADAAPDRTRDRFDMLAAVAIEEWTQKMQALAESRETLAVFRLPRETALTLAAEIVRAARRLDLRGAIAGELHRRASFQQRGAAAAQKPVTIVEQAINNFVYRLGYDGVPPEKRPTIPSGARKIFAERPPIVGLPPLGPAPTPYDRTFHVDWIAAVAKVMEDNVLDASASDIDVAQNTALGKILQRLGAPG